MATDSVMGELITDVRSSNITSLACVNKTLSDYLMKKIYGKGVTVEIYVHV